MLHVFHSWAHQINLGRPKSSGLYVQPATTLVALGEPGLVVTRPIPQLPAQPGFKSFMCNSDIIMVLRELT
jgi:hypothetical protein